MKIPKEWNVLPLKKNKKFPPLLKDWQNTRYPREKLKGHDGNYALGTGMISGGLVVFDWDFRRGFERKEKGVKIIYDEFKKKHPRLAKTTIVETPHGYHFYYILKDEKVSNTSQTNICYDKKKFISSHSTRFGKWLTGLDTRANGGYVVCPPSIVDGNKYRWKLEMEPIEITTKEYDDIVEFFKVPKKDIAKNTVRQGFVDILEGKINPQEIKTKEFPEQVYWKEMYHECYRVGLLPEDLFEGLVKFQKGFDLEKTKVQLKNQKNHEYIFNGKRLSMEKYEKYFKLTPKPKISLTGMFDEDDFEVPLQVIEYDNGEIHIYENYITYTYLYRKKVRTEKILDCKFEIIRKCYHKKEERFTYILKDRKFYTQTILEILHSAEPYLRRGQRGRDCLKEVISYMSKNIVVTKPQEYLGWDNGWILPQTEEEKGISIIAITDYQQEAYERTLKIIEEYTDKQKDKIKKLLKEFILKTQCEPLSLIFLISWSMAAPFRLFFIEEYDLFPILYNYGPPNTGRSSLEDFWIIDFYKIYKEHLPPNTSLQRLEDHLSTSTFPYSLQDLKETNINRDLISMIQEYSTSVGLFERKKSSKEIDFIKYKTSGLNLDSNDILDSFSLPAINERQIFVQYTQKIILDPEWVKMRKRLKKYKLFSFIYDYTQDWTNKDIEEKYLKLLEEFSTSFECNSSRLLKSAAIIRFGIDLFHEIFGLKFKISNQQIMDTVNEGSMKMTAYIVDQFREFCKVAISFDENYSLDNPRYINHKLQMDSKKKYYAYTSSNHEDYKKRFNERCGMKSLVDKIQKGLSLKDSALIEYITARPFQENGVKCKPMGIIKIFDTFLSEELDARPLEFTTILKEYGEPPSD